MCREKQIVCCGAADTCLMTKQLCFRSPLVPLCVDCVAGCPELLPGSSVWQPGDSWVFGCFGFFFPWFWKKVLYSLCSFSSLTLKSSNTSLKLQRKPRESDFETIKLISNGAYGWVILDCDSSFAFYFCLISRYFLFQGSQCEGVVCTLLFSFCMFVLLLIF